MSQNDQLSLLNYYIPARSKIPSPCSVLYPRAVHLDGSNWIIKQSLIPWNTLNQIVAGGGKFWTYKFDQSEQQNLMRDATASIRKELEAAQLRLDESLARIDQVEAENTSPTWRERQKLTKDRQGAVKRLNELTKKLEAACREYGIDATSSLGKARKYSNDLTRVNFVRAALVADLAEQVVGTEMEAAARNDEVPVGILADYAEDHGIDVTAVRQAMSDSPSLNGHAMAMVEAPRNDYQESEVAPESGQEPIQLATRLRPEVEATYARLSDRSWGVRIASQFNGISYEGDVVTAVRSTGQRRLVRLGRLDRRFREASLWTFEDHDGPAPVASPVPVVAEPESILPTVEEQPKPEKTTTLLVKGAWTLTYRIDGDTATVERSFNADTVETLEMSRKAAQDHFRASEAQGWKRNNVRTEDF